jgi:hypothetical protein
MIDPLDPCIGRHSIREGEFAISLIWLGLYAMILCAGLLSHLGDQITDGIKLTGLF